MRLSPKRFLRNHCPCIALELFKPIVVSRSQIVEFSILHFLLFLKLVVQQTEMFEVLDLVVRTNLAKQVIDLFDFDLELVDNGESQRKESNNGQKVNKEKRK